MGQSSAAIQFATSADRANQYARVLGLTPEQAEAIVDSERCRLRATGATFDWGRVRARMMQAADGLSVMPRVNGTRYFCPDCGAGVFTKFVAMYVCNGCGGEFVGE